MPYKHKNNRTLVNLGLDVARGFAAVWPDRQHTP